MGNMDSFESRLVGAAEPNTTVQGSVEAMLAEIADIFDAFSTVIRLKAKEVSAAVVKNTEG